ncbi:MAG: hypothetical protein IPM01_02760 [Burkholderiaceae bacterium]|nr:hypothetical protein [Burkholderiaceae bacterium]
MLACGGGGSGTAGGSAGEPAAPAGPLATVQERQCHDAGWQREVLSVAGLQRLVLWKAPPDGRWRQGAVIVMHGGGGSHTNFCVANVPLIEPQVRFTAQALAAGFAVFLLDSSDRVSDQAGRLCGKVWDDEVQTRASLDLPFIDQVLGSLIPGKRPPGGRPEVFATGLSSGAFMTVRAASRFGDRLTAFAPVSGGDPWLGARLHAAGRRPQQCVRRGARPRDGPHDQRAGRLPQSRHGSRKGLGHQPGRREAGVSPVSS